MDSDIRGLAVDFAGSMLCFGPIPFIVYYVISGGNPWWLTCLLPVIAVLVVAFFPTTRASVARDEVQAVTPHTETEVPDTGELRSKQWSQAR